MRRSLGGVLVLCGLSGCTDKGDPAAAVCEDGTTGPWVEDGGSLIVVSPDGDDAADGDAGAPLASLDAALAAAGDGATILLAPGDHAASAELVATGARDLRIAGCGPDSSRLVAADDGAHVLKLVDAGPVSLAGLGFQGGTRALWIQGATEVHLEAVEIRDAARVGLLVLGAVRATLVDVEVHDVRLDTATTGAATGYGISVTGADVTTDLRAGISMQGGGIWGAAGVGLLAAAADLTVDGVEIADTASVSTDAGEVLGRGLQVQTLSTLALSGSRLAGNADAGLFALDPITLTATANEIAGTGAADVDGGEARSGDGIVVARSGVWTVVPTSVVVATLADNLIDDNARAGIVAQDTWISATGNGGENGYSLDGTSFFIQTSTGEAPEPSAGGGDDAFASLSEEAVLAVDEAELLLDDGSD